MLVPRSAVGSLPRGAQRVPSQLDFAHSPRDLYTARLGEPRRERRVADPHVSRDVSVCMPAVRDRMRTAMRDHARPAKRDHMRTTVGVDARGHHAT